MKNLNLSLRTISLASCDTVVEALCLALKCCTEYRWFGSILSWVELNFSSFFCVILKDKNEQHHMDN